MSKEEVFFLVQFKMRELVGYLRGVGTVGILSPKEGRGVLQSKQSGGPKTRTWKYRRIERDMIEG